MGNYIKIKIKERKWYLIVLSIFWLYVIGVLQCFNVTNTEYKKSNNVSNLDVHWEQLLAGTVVEQELDIEDSGLRKIGITFGTSGRENNCSLRITFCEKEKNVVLYDEIISGRNLVNLDEYVLSFEDANVEKGTYLLSIKGIDGTEDNVVALLCTNNEAVTLKMKRNNNCTENAVCINAYYNGSKKIGLLKILIYILLIILSYATCIFVSGADEKNFVYLVLLFGCAFIILNPAFHALDESTHYFRSFAASTGQLIDSINENGDIGAFLPENYPKIHSEDISIKSIVMKHSLCEETYSKTLNFQVNPYAATYLPIAYLISGVGIFIGFHLGLPAFIVFYLSRLSVLLVYMGLGYLAIKRAKYYKSIFFIAAMLPASMWLAGSCSLDPIINGTSLLFISICLDYKWGDAETVSVKDMIWLIICGTLIASVKYLVYTPILLLFFVIPKEKFKKNQRNIMIVIALCIVVCCLGGQTLLKKKFPHTEDRNGDVDVARQMQFILQHPYTALRTLCKYAVTSLGEHIEGFRYESATGFFAKAVSVLGIVAAPVIAKDKYTWKNEELKSKKVLSILMVFIILAVTSLTIVALYMGYTPVGSGYVDGVQTRYFIPILVLVMILLSNCKVENKIEKYELFLPNLMILGLVDTLVGITCQYL